MSTIIDCIRSLGDTLMVLGMWAGASGVVWLSDIVKEKRQAAREAEENVHEQQPERSAPDA